MRFDYKARNTDGKMISGVFEGEGTTEINAFFLRSNLIPIQVTDAKPKAAGSADKVPFFEARFSEVDMIAFTRQMAAAYAAGIPILQTINLLAKQCKHVSFTRALHRILKDVQSGVGISDAFAQHPNFFTPIYLAAIKAGEATGRLDIVLEYAAGILEKKLVHRERINSALLYPKLVLGMMGIASAVIVTYVIPQFAKMYENFNAQLPLPTRILISLSDNLKLWWWAAAALAPVSYFSRRYLRQSRGFMLYFDRRVLSVPVIGNLLAKVDLSYFCSTYALLLRSGINILQATQTAIDGVQNSFLRQELSSIIGTITRGGSISSAFEEMRIIPPLVTSMVTVGEQSGELDNLLERVAILYDNETDLILKKLPTLLEPIILAILFAAVLFLALAVYLPMWKMASFARGK